MKTTRIAKCLPILWFFVAVSTLVCYERNWETGNKFFFDGFGTGISLSIILAIALVIRIFWRVEDILIARGTIQHRVSTPYDMFPFPLLLLFGFGCQWFGDKLPPTPLTTATHETVYQWVFKWGVNENKFWIYLAILGLIFLYRIHQLLAAVASRPTPSAKPPF
jgi:hypothetical protein